MRKLLKSLFVLVLLGILGYALSNQITNSHAHMLADGTIIQHAHPYQKSDDATPFKKHHHKSWEYVLIDQVNTNLLVFLAAILLLSAWWQLKEKSFVVERLHISPFHHSSRIYLRGPPALI